MKILRKNDIILFFAIAIISLALVFLFRLLPQGTKVVISVDNKEYGSYSLFEDKTVKLDGNTVIINNGTVKMQSADCPHKICERHSAVSRKGESIVCLPHRVIVEVE